MTPARGIFTIGHSTHPAERFVRLVRAHGVDVVCDVRRFPASRRNPQFNADALRDALDAAGIAYESFGDELGGRRKPRSGSEPSPWRNPSFRGYAEYMETDGFARGLERLEGMARERRAAIMCAEGDWRRCHRRLISDTLVARGWRVTHIGPDGRDEGHQPTLSAN
jgi:uncharacterized protein (DUF488 family)